MSERWRAADPLLPEPLPARWRTACGNTLTVPGAARVPAALGTCVHEMPTPGSLSLAWSMAATFRLEARVAGGDAGPALDRLLSAWRRHLAGLAEAVGDDTGALVAWPSRDLTGIPVLARHGLQPLTVLAARPAARPTLPGRPGPARPGSGPAGSGIRVRRAGPRDIDVVCVLHLEVIRFDARLSGVPDRLSNITAVRAAVESALAGSEPWVWLAEKDGEPAGLAMAERPGDAAWVAPMAAPSAPAYLACMGVPQALRGLGAGAALVAHLHRELDAAGVPLTLLHYGGLNPLSGPFWNRMGYRPLWTLWEVRPADVLR